jgi:uncharacterized membrane protein YgdD (TMEM256/DUF423 family)
MKNLGSLSGILGLTAVALGAFGAHALKDSLLAHGTLDVWETAARYHLAHAIALLALAACGTRAATNAGRDWRILAGRCFFFGVVLFSGSLYGYALGGPHFLVFLTPLGGLTLLLGWLAVIVHFASGAGSVARDGK